MSSRFILWLEALLDNLALHNERPPTLMELMQIARKRNLTATINDISIVLENNPGLGRLDVSQVYDLVLQGKVTL